MLTSILSNIDSWITGLTNEPDSQEANCEELTEMNQQQIDCMVWVRTQKST